MIILDTNVVSELMNDTPQPEVLAWADSQPIGTLFTTAITEAEVWAGIAVLPYGRRRRNLAVAAERVFSVTFAERVLPFDSEASHAYEAVAGARRAAGRLISSYDCLIAAIASANGAVVATRNVRDFLDCGVEITNPWDG